MAIPHLSQLNNTGCNHLDRGDVGLALQHFKMALSVAKSMILDDPSLSDEDSARTTINRTKNIQPISNQSISNLLRSRMQLNCRKIYTRGMWMWEDVIFSNDEMENHRVYTSIVLFNLALCFHLEGLWSKERISLAKAGKLYENSFNIIERTLSNCYRLRATGNVLLDTLVMGMFNNMGFLHLTTCDFEASSNFFQFVIRFASSMLPEGVDVRNSNMIIDNEIADPAQQPLACRFIQNAMTALLGQFPSEATTAAAA